MEGLQIHWEKVVSLRFACSFATLVVVDGDGVRVPMTLDNIDDLMGYVAAAANHSKTKKLRKELDRLFDKLQGYLDRYEE